MKKARRANSKRKVRDIQTWRYGWESQVSRDQEMKLLRIRKRTRTDAEGNL